MTIYPILRRISNGYFFPKQPPTQGQVDHARTLVDAGQYSDAWRYLAELGDSYADNAADVTGYPKSGIGRFMQEFVKQHWISTVGEDVYNEKFNKVAKGHINNYLDILEKGNWPTTRDIEVSYRKELIDNGLPAMTAIDGAINQAEGPGLWPLGLEIPINQLGRYDGQANEFPDLPSDEARAHLAKAFLETLKNVTINAKTAEDRLVIPLMIVDAYLHGTSYFTESGELAEIIDPNWEEKLSSYLWDIMTKNNGWGRRFWLFSKDNVDSEINDLFNDAYGFMPRIDPLAIDLNGDGVQTISVDSGVLFDFNDDQMRTGTGWLDANDGFLAYDRNSNGIIDNGSELFGVDTRKSDGNFASDGFDALRDLDSNGDGVFNAEDTEFTKVRIWQDKNSDGISQSDELKTLDELGHYYN